MEWFWREGESLHRSELSLFTWSFPLFPSNTCSLTAGGCVCHAWTIFKLIVGYQAFRIIFPFALLNIPKLALQFINYWSVSICHDQVLTLLWYAIHLFIIHNYNWNYFSSCLEKFEFIIFTFTATLCNTHCLLVSNTTDIFTLDFQTSTINSVVSGLSTAAAIDVHFSLGLVFWSDLTELNIKRLQIDTDTTTTIISNIGVCYGLAVEWRTSKLYWTDAVNKTISVSDLGGNNQNVIFSVGLNEPRRITLDPDNE